MPGGRPRGHRTPEQWARVLPTWDLRVRVLSLRAKGWTLSEIGVLLGVSKQRVYQLVQRARRHQAA